jgi:ferredoxin
MTAAIAAKSWTASRCAPVDCFYEGENMLVIHPDASTALFAPECPVDAIKPDTDPGLEKWL